MKFFKACLSIILVVLLFAFVSIGILYFYSKIYLADVKILKDIHLQCPLEIMSRDGVLMTSFGTKRRIPVKMANIPKKMVQAVVATEDSRYFSHVGVDLISTARALKAVIIAGEKVQGASTITMQVARMFFLEKRKTLARKFREVILAIKIERTFSKEKILELYLNKAYLGERAYGIVAAAKIYFGKDLDRLSLSEIAMIAGLFRSPSIENPVVNFKKAMIRRNHVLERMFSCGVINRLEYEKALKDKLILKKRFNSEKRILAPYVSEYIRAKMYKKYGEKIYESGLKIYTTIDSKAQKIAEDALIRGVFKYSNAREFRKSGITFGRYSSDEYHNWVNKLKLIHSPFGLEPVIIAFNDGYEIIVLRRNGDFFSLGHKELSIFLKDYANDTLRNNLMNKLEIGDLVYLKKVEGEFFLTQKPYIQGAIVSMNPQSGAVLALSGGYDFNLSKFNRAIDMKRQVGSILKPILYSAALERGYTLASIFNDAPFVMSDSVSDMIWRPLNNTKTFRGPTRLRRALTESRNLVSIRVLQAIGINFFKTYLSRFGIDGWSCPGNYSLALGAIELSPYQIVRGYSVFANGGYLVRPFMVEKIVDGEGKVLYNHYSTSVHDNVNTDKSSMPSEKVIGNDIAYLITDVLKDVVRNDLTANGMFPYRGDLAGKTGTTNDTRDNWFVGYNSSVVTAVWIGFDNMNAIEKYAVKLSFPIWNDFMKHYLKDTKENIYPKPDNIELALIDPESGNIVDGITHKGIWELLDKRTIADEDVFNPEKSDNMSYIGDVETLW